MKKETNRDVLIRLSDTNTSNDRDSQVVQYLLSKLGFPRAVVTTGIVYLEGKSTLENPPVSIHGISKTILKGLKDRV